MKQLGLPLGKARCGWGGRRAGSGRKKKTGAISHSRRPFHEKAHPTHVTVRVVDKVGTLRRGRVMAAVMKRMRRVAHSAAFAARRATFRVVHFSVMHDHVHLIVEAGSARSMSRGMQGLLAWVARDVNRRLQRRGRLFAARFHARDLTSLREIRNAIRYVYTNKAKHHDYPKFMPHRIGMVEDGIDPCSSAAWVDVWKQPPPPEATLAPVCRAKTWLLAVGWRRHGLIGRDEAPAG